MNLQRLFDMQRQLDTHIEKEHPREPGEDRLAKKILALKVNPAANPLLRFLGTWHGDDFEECLRDVYKNRIEAKFS